MAQWVKDSVLSLQWLGLLLWLGYRPVATAPIRPLAWEPPYASDVVLKRQTEKKKKERKKENDNMLNEKCLVLKTGCQSKMYILVQMRVIQRNAKDRL